MRMTGRLLMLSGGLAAVAVTLIAAATAAPGAVSAGAKPIIGAPVAVPAQPQAGKVFSVLFKVTRGISGASLAEAKMTFDPTINGRLIRHTESFRGGTARARFVIPADAGGKLLKLKLTIRAGGLSATKVVSYKVRGGIPTVSIGNASVTEGNSGSTALSFPVTLSTAATQAVSVSYATADGSATAPSDYAAASGKLTFQPGEKAKSIPVSVATDLSIEPDETLTMTISSPVNAVIGSSTGTGTITNDDTAAPITAGLYKGATQEGNFVYFTVQPDRTVTAFRANDLSASCDPGGLHLAGAVNWGSSTFPIAADGTFTAQNAWSGSDVEGDAEFTSDSWLVTGTFTNASSLSGKISLTEELNYQGTHYRCTTSVTWTATLQ